MALVAPLLFGLLFGIIDFGNVYSRQISLRNGVASAARQASVGDVGTSSTCTLSPAPAPPTVAALLCNVKAQSGISDASQVRVKLLLSEGYERGRTMVVCVEHPISSLSGAYSPVLNGKHLQVATTVRVERLVPDGSLTTTAEDPLSGSWSWCN